MEPTGKTQGTYRENTGTYRENTGIIQGNHRDYDMNTLGMKVPLKFLFRLIAL